MLLMLPVLVGILWLNVWILRTSLRKGVYHLKGGGQRTPGSTASYVSFSVSRDDSPITFRLLAAFNLGLVLLISYVVYVAAGETYKSWLAGEW